MTFRTRLVLAATRRRPGGRGPRVVRHLHRGLQLPGRFGRRHPRARSPTRCSTAQSVPNIPNGCSPPVGHLRAGGGRRARPPIPMRPTWSCPSPRRSEPRPPAGGGRRSGSSRTTVIDGDPRMSARSSSPCPPGSPSHDDQTRPASCPWRGALQLTVPADRRQPRAPASRPGPVADRPDRRGPGHPPRPRGRSHRAATAQQPHRHRRGAGRDHRRVQASRPRWSRRARPAAPGLQPAAGGPRHLHGRASANWCSTPPTSCAPR